MNWPTIILVTAAIVLAYCAGFTHCWLLGRD